MGSPHRSCSCYRGVSDRHRWSSASSARGGWLFHTRSTCTAALPCMPRSSRQQMAPRRSECRTIPSAVPCAAALCTVCHDLLSPVAPSRFRGLALHTVVSPVLEYVRPSGVRGAGSAAGLASIYDDFYIRIYMYGRPRASFRVQLYSTCIETYQLASLYCIHNIIFAVHNSNI